MKIYSRLNFNTKCISRQLMRPTASAIILQSLPIIVDPQVDFCESSPCQNNASCYGNVGNYTCACALGWTGYHCTIKVDACDSSPCQNGGNCTKKPQAEYECTCTPEYEGAECGTKKDPCDPSPCQNSGTCVPLTYDTYNCSCVYGWDGVNCDSYLGEVLD